MDKSKLIQTLKLLDAQEFKRLLPFLKSPIYNSNQHIINLYYLLRPLYPAFSSKRLDKKKVFDKLFPKRAYDNGKMLNLLSDFNILVKKYLVFLQIENDVITNRKLLISAYAERPGASAEFSKESESFHQYLDSLPFRDERYFNEKKELHLMQMGSINTDILAIGREALPAALTEFEALKNLTDIKFKCAIHSWKNQVGPLMKNNSNDKNVNTLLHLYTKVHELQNQAEPEAIRQAIAYFAKEVHLFRKEDQSNILKILLNIVIQFINRGNADLIRQQFELYQIGVHTRSLMIEGKFTDRTFYNIVVTALGSNELEWARQFIAEYQSFLQLENREEIIAISKGHLHFVSRDWHKASVYLQYPFKEIRRLISAKSLLIRIWFELALDDAEYFNFLMTQLDNFNRFIKRQKKISKSITTGYLSFISYTRKLAVYLQENKDTANLQTELLEAENLVLKKWLLSKTSRNNK